MSSMKADSVGQKLTLNQARHLALRSQGLLDRYPDPLSAMEAVVAVQSQYAVSVVPALFARAKGVTARKVDRMLLKERTLIKSWNLRHTLHCFRSQDLVLFHHALGKELYRRFADWMNKYELFEVMEMADLENGIMQALDGRPMAREELHRTVEALQQVPHAGWGADVKGLAYKGDLVMCEQGASRSKFARRDQWLPDLEMSTEMPDMGIELWRRYLQGHGLATVADFRYWVGVTGFDIKAAHAVLRDECVEVDVEGRKCLALCPVSELPDAPPRTCRFLAKFDPLIMGWKDKSMFLDPEDTGKVVRPAGQIEATLLLDGKIVATWRLERKGDTGIITVFPFKKIAKRHVSRILREANALGKAMGFKEVQVRGLEG